MRTPTSILPIIAGLFPLFASPVYTAAFDNTASFDALIRQGRDAFLASDLDHAESAYSQACPAELVRAYPVARWVTCEDVLASVDEARGNLDHAEQRYLHAVAGAEQAGPAYRPLYCAKLIDLGEHYHRQGRFADAEGSLRKAVELARTLTAVKPQLLQEALIRLGGLYASSAQPERGRAPLTEALSLAAAPGENPPASAVADIAYARNCLGIIDLAAGRQQEAESSLRESVALATSALGEDHPVTAAYQSNLALALLADRQYGRAGLLLRRAQFVVESHQGSDSPELAVICAELSDVAASEGKMAQAEDYAQRAIQILNLQRKPDLRALAVAQITLAGIYVRNHNSAAAEKILPDAVRAQRETGANRKTLAASVELLGELRVQQRNWPEAEALYREALGLYEHYAGTEANASTAPGIANLLRSLADVLKHEGGSKQEVHSLESQARDLLRSVPRA